ncbi:MAG: hypothetical protein ACO1PW_06150, partial [Actinomycetota bacterium]
MGTIARTLVASLALGTSLVVASPALASPPPGPGSFGAGTPAPEPEPTPQPQAADDLVAEPDAPAGPTVSLAGTGIDEGDALELTGIIFEGALSAPCAGPVVLTPPRPNLGPEPWRDEPA